MNARQRARVAAVSPVLKKHNYYDPGLYYLPARELNSIAKYLSDTPRVTEIGRTLTEKDAADIVGITIRGRGDLRVAMMMDCIDSMHNSAFVVLARTGFRVPGDHAMKPHERVEALSEEEKLALSAVLYAERTVFEKFAYHRDSKTEKVSEFYMYIHENYKNAGRIMDIAKSRYILDVELIDSILKAEVPALDAGVL